MNDMDKERIYRYSDGTVAGYSYNNGDSRVEKGWDAASLTGVSHTNWQSGEPNDYSGDENCVNMYRGGTWNDLHCDSRLPFICELDRSVMVRLFGS